ncbi:MAG TPA: FMN-binding protein [Spirochaetia bacterium]|nr:FMN-binding protein [Spirochaetia bacterium]
MKHIIRIVMTAALSAGVSLGAYVQTAYGQSRTFTPWPASSSSSSSSGGSSSSAGYTDGTFVGRREYAYYGTVQVEAVINGGNIVDVRFLDYPNDNGTSRYINSVAIPTLIREAVGAQGSRVNLVSGATYTSEAFHNSLHTALLQAVN